jgi:hypothetical protein
MPPDLPGLSGDSAPLRLKFGCAVDLRRSLDHFLVVERLPRCLAGDLLD